MKKKFIIRAVELMHELLATFPANLSERSKQLETIQRIKDFINQNKNHNIKIVYRDQESDFHFYIGSTNKKNKNAINYVIYIDCNFTVLRCEQIHKDHSFLENI